MFYCEPLIQSVRTLTFYTVADLYRVRSLRRQYLRLKSKKLRLIPFLWAELLPLRFRSIFAIIEHDTYLSFAIVVFLSTVVSRVFGNYVTHIVGNIVLPGSLYHVGRAKYHDFGLVTVYYAVTCHRPKYTNVPGGTRIHPRTHTHAHTRAHTSARTRITPSNYSAPLLGFCFTAEWWSLFDRPE